MISFVRECTKRYGKAKLVLKHNRFYVESDHPSVLRELLRDPLISQARVNEEATGEKDADGFVVQKRAEEMDENLKILQEPGDDESDDEEVDIEGRPVRRAETQPKLTTVAFQVKGEQVEVVKKQAIELDYPLMEECEFWVHYDLD